MTKIKVLLVDDHKLVLDGLALLLATEPTIEVIGSEINGKLALKFIDQNTVDVVLLDIHMPVMDGLKCCEEIKKKYPATGVIVLSMLNEITIIKKMSQLGANGYLLKNSGREKIVESIHSVASGGSYFDPALFEKLPKQNEKQNIKYGPHLSKREKQILELIADEFTTSEISEKLDIAFGTVETHRRNLINKLKVRNTAGLIREAMHWGLIK